MPTKKQKWYDQGIQYCLYAMAVIIPVIFSPAFHTVFSAPKLLALRVITLLILLLWGAKVYIEEKITLRRGPLNTAILIYGIISILTTIYSVAFYTSLLGAQGRFLGIFTLINLLFLPLLVWNHLNKKQVITVLKVSTITASLLALYGIAQYFGLFQEGFNWDQSGADRVFGTIGHGNHFGAYLGMNLLLGLFLIPTFFKKWQKTALALGLALQFTTLIFTASRGAFVATLIAGAISGTILAIRQWQTIKTGLKKLFLPLFLIIAITIAAIAVFGKDLEKLPIIDRTVATITAARDGIVPDRVSWWMSSLDMIAERPLLGFGLSTYRDIYNQFRRTDYRTLENNGMQDIITPETAHNEYLNMAATQGILGLAAFLSIIILVFWRINKFLKTTHGSHKMYPVLGVKAALMVYLLQVFMSFGVIATLVPFYLLLGAAYVLTEKKSLQQQVPIKGLKKVIFTIFLLSGMSIGAIASINNAMAEVHYKSAVINPDRDKAMYSYQAMIAANPYDYAYHQILGDAALQSSRALGIQQEEALNFTDTAIYNYENALLINNLHPSTYYNLGIAFLQRYAYLGDPADYAKANYALEEAVTKAANNPLYPYQVAKAFLSIETPEARQKATEFLERALQIRRPFRDAEAVLLELKGGESHL